jgi:hypothetical protein
MFFKALLAALLVSVPTHVFADYGILERTVNAIGGPLPYLLPGGTCTAGPACGFVNLAQAVVIRLRPLLTGAAVLVIVIFGYRMIVGQEDDALAKAKTIMSGTMAGLVLVWLIDPFIAAFYGQAGEVAQGGMVAGASVLSAELSGLINWVSVIAASLSILMIILTGLKALGKSTSEDASGSIRKTTISVAAGLVLLVLHTVISNGFIDMDAGPSAAFLEPAIRVIAFLMSFLALAAVFVIVYAGVQLVLSFGNEEAYTKAKGILIRGAIGAIILIVSWALVNFIILPTVAE